MSNKTAKNTKKTPKYEIDMKKLPALIVLLIGIVILTVVIFTLDGRVKERDTLITDLTAKNTEYAALVTDLTAQLDAAAEEVAAANAALLDKDAALSDANTRIDAAEAALTQIQESLLSFLNPPAAETEAVAEEVPVEEAADAAPEANEPVADGDVPADAEEAPVTEPEAPAAE